MVSDKLFLNDFSKLQVLSIEKVIILLEEAKNSIAEKAKATPLFVRSTLRATERGQSIWRMGISLNPNNNIKAAKSQSGGSVV
jgi:hypothetical protein